MFVSKVGAFTGWHGDYPGLRRVAFRYIKLALTNEHPRKRVKGNLLQVHDGFG